MYAKILVTADIRVLTGLHIGGSSAFSAIGAVDSHVARDSVSGLPLIPGSSLKGKMRTLLAKSISRGNLPEWPHLDPPEVLRLFGNHKSKPITQARLKFNDCFMRNAEELGVAPTEVKYENTIERRSGVAKPRQIERVVKGSVFRMELFYEFPCNAPGEAEADFRNMGTALRLVAHDYLGGHGTRGYGNVKFDNLKAEEAVGKCGNLDKLAAALVGAYENGI